MIETCYDEAYDAVKEPTNKEEALSFLGNLNGHLSHVYHVIRLLAKAQYPNQEVILDTDDIRINSFSDSGIDFSVKADYGYDGYRICFSGDVTPEMLCRDEAGILEEEAKRQQVIREEEAKRKKAEAIRVAEYNRKKQEEKDRDEYRRLQQKFEGNK